MMTGMRRGFLRGLGGVLGGSALVPLAVAARAEPGKEIRLLVTHVVGDSIGVAANTVRAPAAGSRVELRRTPQDSYDRSAVQVWTPDGRLLGRVAPIDGKALSSLMDAGLRTRAEVISVREHPVRPDIRIEVSILIS